MFKHVEKAIEDMQNLMMFTDEDSFYNDIFFVERYIMRKYNFTSISIYKACEDSEYFANVNIEGDNFSISVSLLHY